MLQRPQIEQDDDGEFVTFPVSLDLATVAWLMDLANACHCSPPAVLAALIADIRRDDEVAHDLAAPARPQVHLN